MRLTTYKDITEKRDADIRQRELEALLRDAIESISEGFVIYDADDRLVLCNDAFRKLYPNAADRMVPGTRYEDILRGATFDSRGMPREGAEAWVAQRLRQHRELKEPVELQLEDGRWLFISERRTSSGGTAGLRVDITSLKRVQQSLHDSQQRLDRTQSIAHLGTVERESAHQCGRVVQRNLSHLRRRPRDAHPERRESSRLRASRRPLPARRAAP